MGDEPDETYEWSAFYDDDGKIYYFNSATEESAWDPPADGKFNPAPPREEGAAEEPAQGQSENTAVEEAEEKEPDANGWVIYKDDEDREYFYNTVTEETQWEKPEGFIEKETDGQAAEDSKEKEVEEDTKESTQDESVSAEQVTTTPAAAADGTSEETLEAGPDTKADEKDYVEDKPNGYLQPSEGAVEDSHVEASESPAEKETTDNAIENATTGEWVLYKDDEGREYYFNTVTEETQWDKPDSYVEPAEVGEEADRVLEGEETKQTKEDEDADDEPTTSEPGEWVAYKDDEGREYYYNATTGETQWDKPDNYVEAPPEDDVEGEPKSADDVVDVDMPETDKAEAEAADAEMEEPPKEPEPEPEPEVDPEVKKLQDARDSLKKTDSILEPGCIFNVATVVAADNGNPKNAVASLIEGYQGQTAMCGLLGRWLSDLRTPASSAADGPSQASTDQVRGATQDVINRLVKERFSEETGDRILDLERVEAAFLEDMMDSSRWRKLLIDLSATHKKSMLLQYCLGAISKRGHHREIAKRVNQSDHFAVFNAMLQNELAIIGKIAVSSSSDAASSVGLEELANDLRRACLSTSYTYVYSLEALRLLEAKAKKLAENSHSEVFRRAIRKWQALVESLESAMIDPTTASSVAGSSPLFRKRRLDVALTVSELHQRQRRRVKDSGPAGEPAKNGKTKDKLETALLSFLRRHSVGMQVDDAAVDALLPSGLDLNTSDETGKLLIEHPLAVKALLGHLFKPGTTRVSSPVLRNKCARLVAFAVLAAEKSARSEGSDRGVATSEASDEVGLTRMIVEACQLCEQLESMVSFLVTDKPRTSTSPGEKLCSIALKYAAVAQGVTIWAYEFTHGPEFAASPAFPTLSVSFLSLIRIISMKYPFTRQSALDIALAFLRHSNADISYQKVNSIKEQSLRLMIFLLLKGDVASVLGKILKRLKIAGSTELDASLVRYFVSGVLGCIRPPVSPEFVISFGNLLLAPQCVDAIRSNYFKGIHRERLVDLLRSFSAANMNSGSALGGDEVDLVKNLLSVYQISLDAGS